MPSLFEGPSVAMISVDAAGKVMAVSPQAETLLGDSEAELIGVSLHQRVHYQRRDGSPVAVEECPLCTAIGSARPAAGDDDVFTRKDGTLVPVAWAVAPIVIAGVHTGAIVAFYFTHGAVTSDRRAQDRLAGARDQLAGARDQLAGARDRLAGAETTNVRLALLADASHALMSAPDLRAGLSQVAQLLVPTAADWVVLDLLDERTGRIERAALAHRHPELERQGLAQLGGLPRLRPAMTSPLATILRGGPMMHLTEFPPEEQAVDELGAARLRLFHLLGTAEAITAPMRTRSRTVGAITLVRHDPARAFEAADMQLVSELATRAAFAVENAVLLERYERRAESLQRALLPEVPDQLGDVELAHLYRPTDDLTRVGGDWYDAFGLADGSTALVIGDVAGHDVHAASRMGAIRHKLRGIAVDRIAPPSEILARLDTVLRHLDPGDLATLVYARLSRRGGTGHGHVLREGRDEPGRAGGWVLEWANAGHPPPLLLTPGGRPRLLLIDPDPPLGVTDVARTDHRIVLPDGATVVFYTDGLIERPDEPIDRGLVRLLERADSFAAAADSTDLEALPEHLAGIVRGLAIDDIAMLAVHLPSVTAPRP